MKLPAITASLLLVLSGVLISTAADQTPAEKPTAPATLPATTPAPAAPLPTPRQFEVILYLVSPAPIPMSKMFEGFAEHGVTNLIVNGAAWSAYADKGLLDYAAAYGMNIFLQAPYIWEGKDSAKNPAKEGEESFRKLVASVRSRPHNQQVVGWWCMDEPESNFRTDNGWNVPKFIKEVNEVNDAIRRLDPGSKVISNHSHTDFAPGDKNINLTQSTDRQWYDTNEDYSSSSNAFCLKESKHTLAQELAQSKRLKRPFYWQNGFCFPPRDLGPNDYSYYGYPSWMNAARFDREYPSDIEVVKDYLFVLQEGGGDGALFFCYEGTPAWLTYALVRPDGSDRGGRWGAVRTAMQEIRSREGAPAVRLANVATVDGKPTATIELTRGAAELHDLLVEISKDDGLTWSPAPQVKKIDAYVSTITADPAANDKTVYRIQAQGSDGRKSLWIIWRPTQGIPTSS